MSSRVVHKRFRGMHLLAWILIFVALTLLAIVVARFASSRGPLLFSPTEVLEASWYSYKRAYVSAEGRTVDPSRGGVTTSEGQAYTMLRAVWVGDKSAFDDSWDWTRGHLERPDDHLFSWLWGPLQGGGYGIRTDMQGQTTASDADSDIALALVFAYARWQDPTYLDAARAVTGDLWDKEVIEINGVPYLASDDREKTAATSWIVVNPSYLSPASYHIFSFVDPAHDWEGLRRNSYVLLRASADRSFDGKGSARLPTDWLRIDRETGAILSTTTAAYDANFGFDAIRVPFRVALDERWFGNQEAARLLGDFHFLSASYAQKGALAAKYAHDGAPLSGAESAATYGATIGYFMSADPRGAARIFKRDLLALYDPTTGTWTTPLGYYGENWAWFGIALYTGALPNLAAGLPSSAFSQYP